MSEFKNIFEHKNIEAGLKKPYEELKTPFKKETYSKGLPLDKSIEEEKIKSPAEKNEQLNSYEKLREDLRSRKKGGGDVHFSQLKIANLSEGALDLYQKYQDNSLAKREIIEFEKKATIDSDDYNFAAMLLNWRIDKAELERAKEKELLKKEAEKKLDELKTIKPHIAAYIDNINLDLLKRLDLKVIKDLDEQSFMNYEKNLREYFRNKTEGKEEIKKEVEKDPRYQWYCMLREILNLGPGRPDIFIN